MGTKMIKRHAAINIFMHWFNACCWLFLLATGLGLIKNAELEILGGWWADGMRNIFGGGETLLLAHVIVGLTWAGVFLIYGLSAAQKHVLPFVREVFTLSPKTDLQWLVKKGLQMTLGDKIMQKMGMAPRIPDQGFYNVGQKLFAVPSVIGGAVITVTGIIMMVSRIYLTNTALVQWAILIHFITVVLTFGGLLIHIYMAAIAAGERPAFISMFTGSVPEDYARHHHRLWYDKVKES